MSATHRGSSVRHPDDYYRTPAWAVRSILPHLGMLSGMRVLEPGCGDGAILSALPHTLSIDAVEMDEARIKAASSRLYSTAPRFHQADYLSWAKQHVKADRSLTWDLVIGNPPFKHALEFAKVSIKIGRTVAFLLRLSWMASQSRADWLRQHCPSIYVLPKRPQFVMSVRCVRASASRKPTDLQHEIFGCSYVVQLPMSEARPTRCPLCDSRVKISTTDAADYAWMVWQHSPHAQARVDVLYPPTPEEESAYP